MPCAVIYNLIRYILGPHTDRSSALLHTGPSKSKYMHVRVLKKVESNSEREGWWVDRFSTFVELTNGAALIIIKIHVCRETCNFSSEFRVAFQVKFHIRQNSKYTSNETTQFPATVLLAHFLTTLQCPPPHHHLLSKYLLNTLLPSTPTTAYAQPSSSQPHTSSPISPFEPLPPKIRPESFLYHDFLIPTAVTQRPQQNLPPPL